jgi:transcriptional regulator with XRE-family HTH domain
MRMQATTFSFGELLREWRQKRRFSQLELACEAEISQRHLSFIESGRATPSRDMVLHLAQQLDVPLRDRNALLLAAGYAPMFQEKGLDDPALAEARAAVELILRAHEPFPALAVDRRWRLIAQNAAAAMFIAGVAPHLLAPPVNVLRLSLHPEGLAPRIANLAEWRGHVLERLRRQHRLSLDAEIAALIKELAELGGPPALATEPSPQTAAAHAIAIPFQIKSDAGLLSFFSTTTVFGTPVEVTLSELMLEAFYPADAVTAEAVRKLSAALRSPHSR